MATAYLRPSADVSLGHDCNTGSTGYNLLNETTQDGDSTYISVDAYNTTETASSTFTATGSITSGHRITAAKLIMYACNDSSSASNSTVQITVGSSSSTQTISTTTYTAFTYNLSTSDITVSGTNVSATIAVKSSIYSSSKSTYNQKITQIYIELTTAVATQYTVTTSSTGTGTVTGAGTYFEQTSPVIKMTPGTDLSVKSVTDNGTDVTSQIVYVPPTPQYSFTGTVSGASYGFATSGQYWVSQNAGQGNSAAVAQLTFTCEVAATLVFAVVNYAEATYDYGIVGAVDQTLSTSYDKDSGTTWDGSDSSKNKETEQDITISLPAGSHFVQIKYRKDSGTSSYNDDFRVRIKSLTYNTSVSGGYYQYTINNISANHAVAVTFSDVDAKYYIKLNGAWTKKPAYQKINGEWVRLTTSQPSGWTSGGALTTINYPYTFGKAFKNTETSGPVDAPLWMVTDYIAVQPDVELIVQGQGSTFSNTMWFAYKSDKSYYDYWGSSGTQITTVDGTIVYQRTLTAANMANTYYVRVNAKIAAWNYIKITQNGVVLFDGSQYPLA